MLVRMGKEERRKARAMNVRSKEDRKRILQLLHDRNEAQKTFHTKQQKLQQELGAVVHEWKHLMLDHSGKRNPHGMFQTASCSLELFEGTNCGIYFMYQNRRCACGCCEGENDDDKTAKRCVCADCLAIIRVSRRAASDSPDDYLWALAARGFTWQFREGQVCDCGTTDEEVEE